MGFRAVVITVSDYTGAGIRRSTVNTSVSFNLTNVNDAPTGTVTITVSANRAPVATTTARARPAELALSYAQRRLWFLDREFSEGSFDHSIFAKNYERVLSAEVAKLFFAEVYDLSRQAGWTSDEHFTADGTLIESWASLKSFVEKRQAFLLSYLRRSE